MKFTNGEIDPVERSVKKNSEGPVQPEVHIYGRTDHRNTIEQSRTQLIEANRKATLPYQTPSLNHQWAIVNASPSCNIFCSHFSLPFFRAYINGAKYKLATITVAQ